MSKSQLGRRVPEVYFLFFMLVGSKKKHSQRQIKNTSPVLQKVRFNVNTGMIVMAGQKAEGDTRVGKSTNLILNFCFKQAQPKI